MAFNQQSWGRMSGAANNVVVTLQSGTFVGAPNLFTYISATDTLAIIEASGYFNSLFPEINIGDLIYAVGIDGQNFLTVSQAIQPVQVLVNVVDGNVSGPASATNNDFVLFNGATGKIIKDAGYSIIPGSAGGTGVANTGITMTLGGNVVTAGAITTTGAFAATFNFSNTTNVNFPTSGTLTTTAQTPPSPANSATLVSTAGGVSVWSAPMTDGQLIIGATGGTPIATSLTGGSGITITPGPNSITITNVSTGTVSSVGLSSTTGIIVGSSPVTTAGTITADLTGSVGGNNLLYNPSFQLWQRGAGGTATFTTATVNVAPFSADRWQFEAAGSGTPAYVMSQQADVNSGSYFARLQRTAGNTNTAGLYLSQTLMRDMCQGMAGNRLTISFTARCGANYSPTSSLFNASVTTGTGTTDISFLPGGVFTGSATPITNNVTLTTTFQRFSITSISAVGSTVSQAAAYFLMTPVGTAGAADYVDIKDIKLEIGPSQTNFVWVPFAQELARCLPFYWKTFLYANAPAANLGLADAAFIAFVAPVTSAVQTSTPNIRYPVAMRASPTITLYSSNTTGAQVYNQSRGAAFTSTTTINPSANGVTITANAPAATVVGDYCSIHVTASAEP